MWEEERERERERETREIGWVWCLFFLDGDVGLIRSLDKIDGLLNIISTLSRVMRRFQTKSQKVPYLVRDSRKTLIVLQVLSSKKTFIPFQVLGRPLLYSRRTWSGCSVSRGTAHAPNLQPDRSDPSMRSSFTIRRKRRRRSRLRRRLDRRPGKPTRRPSRRLSWKGGWGRRLTRVSQGQALGLHPFVWSPGQSIIFDLSIFFKF